MMFLPNQHQLRRTYEMLNAAAEAGAPAPSNTQIADMLDCAHHGDASELVRRLEELGHIRVVRSGSARTVTIAATGKTIHTAQARPPHAIVTDDGYRGPVPEHQRVDRDPCFYCGARRDVGCVHLRVAA